MAKLEGIEKQVNKIDQSENRHLQRVRSVRHEVLKDESLDPLDRAVFGMTGSKEQLDKYRALAELVGDSKSQPIILVQEVGYDLRSRPDVENVERVRKATAGIISGGLVPEVKEWGLLPGRDVDYSATLSVPVSPVASYLWSPSRTELSGDHYFLDEETSDYSDNGGKIAVAHFQFAERKNQTTDPLSDVQGINPADDLLVGSEAIYAYERFQEAGVMGLLVKLEERARLQAAGEQ